VNRTFNNDTSGKYVNQAPVRREAQQGSENFNKKYSVQPSTTVVTDTKEVKPSRNSRLSTLALNIPRNARISAVGPSTGRSAQLESKTSSLVNNMAKHIGN
jgi:hypothetical protein